MSDDTFLEPVLQLNGLQRLIAKYAIRNAIEKLVLVNLGRKKQTVESLSQRKKLHLSSEADSENNVEKVKSVLIDICREIECDGTFEKLQKYLGESPNSEPVEGKFLRDYSINKATAEYLEKKVPATQKILEKAQKDMRIEENLLGKMSLNSIKQNEIESRYNNSWEAARLDQLNYALENEEHQNYLQYDRYKMLLAREEEAAKNLIDCYQAKINFLEDNLEYWTGEYERQMENVVTDINLTQDWINELEKKVANQEKTYKEYQDDVNSYFTKKLKIRYARKIQKWWREKQEQRQKQLPARRSPNRTRKRSPQNLNGPAAQQSETNATTNPPFSLKPTTPKLKKPRLKF